MIRRRTALCLAAAAWAAASIPVALAIPNPASVFCERMGGKPVIAVLPDQNRIGLCYLPGGRIVEEWTLLRMLGGKVPQPGQSPFR